MGRIWQCYFPIFFTPHPSHLSDMFSQSLHYLPVSTIFLEVGFKTNSPKNKINFQYKAINFFLLDSIFSFWCGIFFPFYCPEVFPQPQGDQPSSPPPQGGGRLISLWLGKNLWAIKWKKGGSHPWGPAEGLFLAVFLILFFGTPGTLGILGPPLGCWGGGYPRPSSLGRALFGSPPRILKRSL